MNFLSIKINIPGNVQEKNNYYIIRNAQIWKK